ncbi:MAG: response regulator [Ferruginibacter sp.]
MSTIRKFILVDDDSVNNLISTIIITEALNKADITSFQVPETALAFIGQKYLQNIEPTILFLDLNMPTLSGWEFMEEYLQFPEGIKEQISIYILTSSIDDRDKDKANNYDNIAGFITKPLEEKLIVSLAGLAIGA